MSMLESTQILFFADNNNGYGCRLTIGDGTSIKELKNMDLDKVYVLCIKEQIRNEF